MRGIVLTVGLITALAVPAAGFSQTDEEINTYIQTARTEVKRDKTGLIGSAMGFTGDEAAKFWPIYKDYEAELTKLGDERLALIKDYAANFRKMTDEKAAELAARAFDQERKGLDLMRHCHARLVKEMSAIVAARFVQVEKRLNLLLELQTAAQIPLMQRGGL